MNWKTQLELVLQTKLTHLNLFKITCYIIFYLQRRLDRYPGRC